MTANAALLTLLTGPRWAIGPRDLALLGRRAGAAGRRRRTAAGPRLADARRGARPSAWRAPTRPRSSRCATRSTTRASRPTPPRRASGSGCCRPSCGRCARTSGEPLLDLVRRIIDTTGIDVELASVGQPGRAAPAATTSTCSSRRSPSSRPSTATSRCRRCSPTSPPRTSRATASTSPRPTEADSVKLLTVHRAKGLEWDVGVPGRRVRGAVPGQPRRARCGRRRPRCCPRRCAATPRPAPAARPRQARRSTRYRADTRAHEATEELRLGLRRLHPGRAPAVGLVVPLEPARRRRSARRRTRRSCRERSTALGRAASRLARQARRRATPTRYAGDDPSRPWPATGTAPRRAPPRRRRAWCASRRPATARLTPSSTWSRPPGSPTGTPSSSGCSPRRGPSAAPTSRCRCPPACRRPRWPGCATTPTAFARELARPMPRPAVAGRPVRHPLPRLGRGPLRPAALLDPDDLPGRADLGIDDEADLDELIATLRGRAVRRPGPARRRGAVRAGPRRPGGPRPDRRGLRRAPTAASCSSTGRPTAARTPTRSSWRSTGWPGPSCAACRSSRCARRSTTCAPARPSSRRTCPDRQALEAMLGA